MFQLLLSQPRPYINELIKKSGSFSTAYLLSANRPSYGISSYLTPKKNMSIGAGFYFNKDIYEFSLDLSYGISSRVEISGGFSPYLKSYNFLGETVKGIGDANAGIKFRFQESYYFDHAFQTIIKIPTASKTSELGTGKADYFFGLVQGFGYKNFGYDLSIEFNILSRKDFPAAGRRMPGIIKEVIDSLKQIYNYSYEPEISFSLSPYYSLSNNFYIYTGYNFTRNTRLNFNTSSLLGGFGFSAGKTIGFSIGASYGLTDNSGWLLSLGFDALIPLK